MGRHEVPPRNRAERRQAARAGKKSRAAGAAITAGSAALAMGAAVLGTGVPGAGAATTLHVTSTADSGAGSLRDTVAAASSGDTISLDVTGLITLTSGEIAFNTDLTFTGPGSGALAMSGNDASRIFYVTGNAAVTISGLSLVHGASADGGAIWTDGPLTLSDTVFDHNVSSDDGGAINSRNAFTATNSTFSNNSTDDWGGAVLTTGAGAPVNVTNTTFVGNTAGDTAGGLAIEGQGNASVLGSTFQGNTASHAGGLVLLGDGVTTISGSTFTGNTANATNSQREGIGGGLDGYETGPVSISNTTISGNNAVNEGGGLSLYAISGLASIDGTTVSGNHSDAAGGGVYTAYTYGGLRIANSSISGNSADRWGGGLYSAYTYQSVDVTNSTISGNSAGRGGGGAQIWGSYIEGTTVSVIDSTISGNTSATSGGGGWIQWGVGGSTTFANSTISGNTANGEGGGLYFYGFYGLSVEMSTITGNTASESTGGVYIATGPDLNGASRGHHERSAGTAAGEKGSDGEGAREARGTARTKVHAAATLADADVTGTILWGNSGYDLGDQANVTLSHDLLGTVSPGIVQTDAGGNVTGTNPELGPLQNNGGATATHALLPGSPAIDAGPDPVPSFPGNEFDQRGAGYARVVGTRSDIGAFEVQPPAPDAVVITPRFTG